jgi:hypothetical protein
VKRFVEVGILQDSHAWIPEWEPLDSWRPSRRYDDHRQADGACEVHRSSVERECDIGEREQRGEFLQARTTCDVRG